MLKSQVHLVSNWAFLLHGPVHFVLDMINISALPRRGRRTKISEVRSCSIKEVHTISRSIQWSSVDIDYYVRISMGICKHIHLTSNQGVFVKTKTNSE